MKTVDSHLNSFIDNFERGMGSTASISLLKRKTWEMATPRSPWRPLGNVKAKLLQLTGFELLWEPKEQKDATTSLHPLD